METGSPKIYTRTGDKGKTSLIGGARVSKSHLRLETYGTIDELNSWIGLLAREILQEFASDPNRLGLESANLGRALSEIQCDLFDIGSQLACEDDVLRAQLPHVSSERVASLEKKMDEMSKELKPLKNFVLPGGARSASVAHLARTVCRRAERLVVALQESTPEPVTNAAEPSTGTSIEKQIVTYINRLSDFFFVLARFLNHRLGETEPIWAPRTKSGG